MPPTLLESLQVGVEPNAIFVAGAITGQKNCNFRFDDVQGSPQHVYLQALVRTLLAPRFP
jgi:hypothetical protein